MAVVPILTYHASRAGRARYAENDHLTLREDLRLLHAQGRRIVSLHAIVKELLAGRLDTLDRCVGLSFDDGTDLDWRDVVHPEHGFQRGLAGILADFAREVEDPTIQATSFVIAGPGPRHELDSRTMNGAGWWNEDWWNEAVRGNLVIENHSWDHNHDQVLGSPRAPGERGTFATIDTWDECDRQIRQAADYIDQRLSPVHRCGLFAYPYGEYSEYLAECYLPEHQHEHRQRAAFTTAGEPVHCGSDRWTLPRFVCGQHWRTPEDLQAILRACR